MISGPNILRKTNPFLGNRKWKFTNTEIANVFKILDKIDVHWCIRKENSKYIKNYIMRKSKNINMVLGQHSECAKFCIPGNWTAFDSLYWFGIMHLPYQEQYKCQSLCRSDKKIHHNILDWVYNGSTIIVWYHPLWFMYIL